MRAAFILLSVAVFYCGCVVDIPPLAEDSDTPMTEDSATFDSAGTGSDFGDENFDSVDTGEATDTQSEFIDTMKDSGNDTATTPSDTGIDTIKDSGNDTATTLSDTVLEDTEPDSTTSLLADFVQTNDENGLVEIEAEAYSSLRAGPDGSVWELSQSIINYSGTGAMCAPVSSMTTKQTSDRQVAEARAPGLQYLVQLVKPEPLYVWLRASHTGGFDDSAWFGKNEKIESDLPLCFQVNEQDIVNQWYYIHYRTDGSRAQMDNSETGIISFELYLREPGFKIDRIVLTTNPAYNPNSEGTTKQSHP